MNKLQVTKNYEMFDLHEFNRSLHKDRVLEASMKKYGFMPSSPIQVVFNGNGKYRIIRGHHRFDVAKRLNLPIYYIVDDSNTDIFNLEAGKQQWNVFDFAEARRRAGDEDCEKLLSFKKKHGIPIGIAASLLGGQDAAAGNKTKLVKNGTFKVSDLKYAERVALVVKAAEEAKISFAKSSAFISAVSKALRIENFDSYLFVQKIKLFPSNLRKRSTCNEYLDEIEALYNYRQSKKTLPVAFLARESAKERQKSFGK